MSLLLMLRLCLSRRGKCINPNHSLIPFPLLSTSLLLPSLSTLLSQRATYMKKSAEGEALKIVLPPFVETQTFNPSGGETLAPSAESKMNETTAAMEEANRIAREIIKKEDDDFEKMEALFIESLELGSSDLIKR